MSKLLWKLFIEVLLIFTMTINIHTNSDHPNSTKLPTDTMIKENGYEVQTHYVHTQDGYILKLYRIPKSRNGEESTKKYPVVFAHCLLGSSDVWILAGRDRSLPMQLADDGFDVWLLNFRGNTYSRGHENLSDKTYAFWDFSLHELGIYDLPAVIDYVLEKSEKEQLHYIGFSMGTTTFFILASEEPKYQKKIRSNISLGPVANIHNSTSSLKTFGPLAKLIHIFVRKIAKGKYLPFSDKVSTIVRAMCKSHSIRKYICLKWFIFLSCGYDPHSFDQELFPRIIGHFPAGTSSKLIVHYSQFITTEDFSQYNHGHKKNLQYYNSKYPPAYNLSSIQVPIYLFYGVNDLLANPKDVERLRRQLPNVMDVIEVDDKYFNHADFVYSKTVTKDINNPVKEILQKYG